MTQKRLTDQERAERAAARRRKTQYKRMAADKMVSELKRRAGLTRHAVMSAKVVDRDARERMAEIPPDTRDLTGRLLGDPLPGRSAFDRRQPA